MAHLAAVLAFMAVQPVAGISFDPPSPMAVVLTLEPPPPPSPAVPVPEAEGSPGPAETAADPAPATRAPALRTPRAPARPRPPRAVPPEAPTLAVVPAPPGPVPSPSPAGLTRSQLAGAATAGSGSSGGDGSGPGAGSGSADGRCDMIRRVQDALRANPGVVAAAARAQGALPADRPALLVWDGDWVMNPGEAGRGLAGVRQAIAVEIAFAPAECRRQAVRGLVLLTLSDAPDAPRLALGQGLWRWSDLTGAGRN